MMTSDELYTLAWFTAARTLEAHVDKAILSRQYDNLVDLYPGLSDNELAVLTAHLKGISRIADENATCNGEPLYLIQRAKGFA